jgi:drug/metabolite transporter (DMT)-like permease
MSTELVATLLVLVAALLHAITNALIKVSGDPLLTRGVMSAMAAAAMLPLLPLVSPPAREAWPILLASVPVHTAYSFLIAAAYRRGDLGAVFPISRGLSPLGVVLLAFAFGVGRPDLSQLAGVVVISLGILLITAPFGERGARPATSAVAYALGAGAVVALYTYLDAIGLRAAGTIAGYIVWLILLDGSVTSASIALVRGRTVRDFLTSHWRASLLAAALGLVNFALAMVALGLGSIVEIAALRETSIVFAAFLGSHLLREGFARRRVLAAACVFAGIAWLQLFR